LETSERMDVGIVVERRRLSNPWQPEGWVPVAVLPGRPEMEPWTLLGEGDGYVRYYAGAIGIELFRGETQNYKHNLEGPHPSVFVILRRVPGPRGVELLAATVDPGEVDAHSDAGDDIIEALPLPGPVSAWIAAFVERHHVERPFHKRQRDRLDPETLGIRRPPRIGRNHD
jgi:hypothetical protein